MREVSVSVIKYIASDGREFFDKDQCEEYEKDKELKNKLEHIKTFYFNGQHYYKINNAEEFNVVLDHNDCYNTDPLHKFPCLLFVDKYTVDGFEECKAHIIYHEDLEKFMSFFFGK